VRSCVRRCCCYCYYYYYLNEEHPSVYVYFWVLLCVLYVCVCVCVYVYVCVYVCVYSQCLTYYYYYYLAVYVCVSVSVSVSSLQYVLRTTFPNILYIRIVLNITVIIWELLNINTGMHTLTTIDRIRRSASTGILRLSLSFRLCLNSY